MKVTMNPLNRSVTRPGVRLGWLLVPLVLLAGAGCNQVTDPSKNVTQTWTGTLAPGGSQTFNFTSANNGEYAITLKALTPDSNFPVGIGFGLQGGGACNLISANSPVGIGFGLAGAINKGDYCALIYDIGVLTQNENFSVDVSHP